MNVKYEVHTTGNWCAGYYWEIVRSGTFHAVTIGTYTGKKESGPYHGECGRKYAFDDAVEWAFKNDLPLISTVNPY